jgi:hypothetical protein
MKERRMTEVDCRNVMRAGVLECHDLESGSWRYQVVTNKMAVVVAMVADEEAVLVSCWRLK